MDPDHFLRQPLRQRREEGTFRELRLVEGLVDFCSNDYLGLATGTQMSETVATLIHEKKLSAGSRGSRLLAGNYPAIEEAETQIAAFHEAESGLLFNSGYDANTGLFSCLPQKEDMVIYDQLIHASIRDGIRLSRARAFSFLHSDLVDLEKKLAQDAREIFVVVESVYSMDGDQAPLRQIAAICRKAGAHLIVDEAHATGVIGPKGEGLVQQEGLQSQCLARVHTFGKALGAHGAIILGPSVLRDFLINFSRPFIYSTALPPAALTAVSAAYQLFPNMSDERAQLKKLIEQFQHAKLPFPLLEGSTPIQILLIPGNERIKQVAEKGREKGLDIRAILHPSVARGSERLRIVLHSFNTSAQLQLLESTLQTC